MVPDEPDSLNDELLTRLSALPKLEQLPESYHGALAGDQAAIHHLRDLTIPLSQTETWATWQGPESPEDICRAIHALLPRSSPKKKQAPPSDDHQLKPWRKSMLEANEPTLTLPSPLTPRSATAQVPEGHEHERPQVQSPAVLNLDDFIARFIDQGQEREPAYADPMDRGTDDLLHPDIHWRDCARQAGFPIERLTRSEREQLDMVSRVLIAGQGWGPRDGGRSSRTEIAIIPAKLCCQGAEQSQRSHQRARAHLCKLGLFTIRYRTLAGGSVITPAWWPVVNTNDPVGVWREAKKRFQQEQLRRVAGDRHSNDAAVAPSCRPFVIPPRSRPSRG